MQYAFGSGLLWASRTDIANATPVRFGAMQDVQIDFSGELKELYGQYQFPLDTARGKVKITGKSKLAQISAVQYNSLFFGQSTATGQHVVADGETGTVPAATPWQITVANGANFVVDLGVRWADTGLPLNLVAASPATGEYSVATGGVYTFATADAGKSVLLDYVYSLTTGTTITGVNTLMGASPRFTATFNNTYEGNQLTLRLFACTSTKLTFATKIDDYTIPELDFSAYANSAGQVYEFSASA